MTVRPQHKTAIGQNCFYLVNSILLKHTASSVSSAVVSYKRRPRRPPFLRVLSDGMGVTSSTKIIIINCTAQAIISSNYLHLYNICSEKPSPCCRVSVIQAVPLMPKAPTPVCVVGSAMLLLAGSFVNKNAIKSNIKVSVLLCHPYLRFWGILLSNVT